MKHAKKFIATLLIGGGLAATSYVGYANAADEVDAKTVLSANVPLTEAVEIALQNVPGMPIAVELEREDGVLLWDVEILDNNQQVMELEIDATSGAVLNKHIDDDEEEDD